VDRQFHNPGSVATLYLDAAQIRQFFETIDVQMKTEVGELSDDIGVVG
jgi:hypothetical protein